MSAPSNIDAANAPAILSAAVGAAGTSIAFAGGNGAPPSPDDKYRFYQCVFEPLHIKCRRIPAEQMHETCPGVVTQLQTVPKWMPIGADRAYIRWRLFCDRTLEFKDNNDNKD
jgi:hypothetical protein